MFSLATRAASRSIHFSQVKAVIPASSSLLSSIRAFSESSDKVSGHVKWFDVKKGFGFITPNDGGDDIFVHQTVINAEGFRSLADGEEVLFNVDVDHQGRKRAADVTGPDGGFVQGAPRRTFYRDEHDIKRKLGTIQLEKIMR